MHRPPVFTVYYRQRVPLLGVWCSVSAQLQQQTQNPRQFSSSHTSGLRTEPTEGGFHSPCKQTKSTKRGSSTAADAGELRAVQTSLPGSFQGGRPVAFPWWRWSRWWADQGCPVPQLVCCAQGRCVSGRQLSCRDRLLAEQFISPERLPGCGLRLSLWLPLLRSVHQHPKPRDHQ